MCILFQQEVELTITETLWDQVSTEGSSLTAQWETGEGREA